MATVSSSPALSSVQAGFDALSQSNPKLAETSDGLSRDTPVVSCISGGLSIIHATDDSVPTPNVDPLDLTGTFISTDDIAKELKKDFTESIAALQLSKDGRVGREYVIETLEGLRKQGHELPIFDDQQIDLLVQIALNSQETRDPRSIDNTLAFVLSEQLAAQRQNKAIPSLMKLAQSVELNLTCARSGFSTSFEAHYANDRLSEYLAQLLESQASSSGTVDDWFTPTYNTWTIDKATEFFGHEVFSLVDKLRGATIDPEILALCKSALNDDSSRFNQLWQGLSHSPKLKVTDSFGDETFLVNRIRDLWKNTNFLPGGVRDFLLSESSALFRLALKDNLEFLKRNCPDEFPPRLNLTLVERVQSRADKLLPFYAFTKNHPVAVGLIALLVNGGLLISGTMSNSNLASKETRTNDGRNPQVRELSSPGPVVATSIEKPTGEMQIKEDISIVGLRSGYGLRFLYLENEEEMASRLRSLISRYLGTLCSPGYVEFKNPINNELQVTKDVLSRVSFVYLNVPKVSSDLLADKLKLKPDVFTDLGSGVYLANLPNSKFALCFDNTVNPVNPGKNFPTIFKSALTNPESPIQKIIESQIASK